MMHPFPFSYQLVRSARRTLSIEIKDGQVIVRCPNAMPQADIDKFLTQKSSWIQSHLEKQTAAPAQPKLTMEEINNLADQALTDLPERVKKFAPLVGVTYGRITIRNQKTLWGSCTSQGNLNFNCLLMLAPPQVRDYVVIHELCHRKEMNHSKKFWAEVERVMPDYRVWRQWIKDNGAALIARMTGGAKTP